MAILSFAGPWWFWWIFQRNTFSWVGRFCLFETYIKELNFVFLKKSELQRQGKLKLIAQFGIPAKWRFHNVMFQQTKVRSNFEFSD